MKRLDRNEVIVALNDAYIESLWQLTDEELEKEFLEVVKNELPYYHTN